MKNKYNNHNIVLVGMMGSGKSSIGKLLADRINYDYIDTDELIEQQQQKSINIIFKDLGENHFRDLEHDVLLSMPLANCVISTGGGMPTQNMSRLKKIGITIFLKAEAKTIFSRLSESTNNRPLFQNEIGAISKLIARRVKYYSLSDISISTDFKNMEEIVLEISNRLNKTFKM